MSRRAKQSSSKPPRTIKQTPLEAYFISSSPSSPSSSPRPKASRPRRKKLSASTARKLNSARVKQPRKGGITDSEEEGASTSDPGKIPFEPRSPSAFDTDEDETKSSPRKPTLSQQYKRKTLVESDEEGAIVGLDSDSNEEMIGVPLVWKGKAKDTSRKRRVIRSDSDEERPRKKKFIKGVRPPTPEPDMMDEVDGSKIVDTRLRSRDKRSLYRENLERLKRKKRGESVASESSETETDPDEYATPFTHARPHTEDDEDDDGSAEAEGEDLNGFIEDDGDTAVLELPPEFSMNTYQDLTHHFKIICQLFVHLAVQKPKDRPKFMERSLKDKYFGVPLQIARRKLEGVRDSLVASSVWRPNFKKALATYPDFELTQMDFALPGCDACHLGGRLSTLLGRASGDPYDRRTFMPVHAVESSDSDDSEDEHTQEFHLGRFCARRTRVYHEFTHWEYALFQALSQEVDSLRDKQSGKPRMFVRVAYAGGVKPPSDLSDADGIMAWLDQRGIIASEYQKINHMMESATHLEVASKRGDQDD